MARLSASAIVALDRTHLRYPVGACSLLGDSSLVSEIMSVQPFATVVEYIAAQSVEAQPRLRELRATIRAALPEAAELISYGMPTYKFGAGAVCFGAAKRHCALYGSALDAFPEDVRGFDTSKGTVRFPLDRPIPEELVRKLVVAKAAAQAAPRQH